MSLKEFGEEALRIVEDGLFVVRDAGPLHAPIWKVAVRRDEKLALVVETEAPRTAASTAVELPSGTVRMSTEKVVLGNPAGVEALLEGVIGCSVNSVHEMQGEGTLHAATDCSSSGSGRSRWRSAADPIPPPKTGSIGSCSITANRTLPAASSPKPAWAGPHPCSTASLPLYGRSRPARIWRPRARTNRIDLSNDRIRTGRRRRRRLPA
jgi:hypothetical protein